MSDYVYEKLAKALDKLPNGFPRTSSNVEIRLLKKIITPEEASLASQLGGSMESVDVIAKRVELPTGETEAKLMIMAEHGLLWYRKDNGKPYSGWRLLSLESTNHSWKTWITSWLIWSKSIWQMAAPPVS